MNALNWAQFVALLAAAAYFLIKIAQGWFVVNLTLSGALDRRARGDQLDDLAVAVTLTKGSTGSLRVRNTAVRVVWEGGQTETRLVGGERLAVREDGTSLVPGWRPQQEGSSRDYRLPPGEGTTWSCRAVVPAGRPCRVEVVVLGRQWPSRFPAQWTLSLVSLPLVPRS